MLFEEPLKKAAEEVANIYPTLIAELEKTLKWKLDYTPGVILIKDRKTFQKMARSELVVAYAVPLRGLVVIDYSRMNNTPFTLRITLKHELCHLLLHCYIQEGRLPKWLDEGIAQWVSDGFGEIIMDRKRSILSKAVLSGNYISIRDLTIGFPQEKASLLLAYEESKDLTEYINRKFGRNAILNILRYLKEGHKTDEAILKSLSIPLDELEKRWHAGLGSNMGWFVYLSNNLYGILFFLAALLTIAGFIRLVKKKT
ncbi:MAG: peptidase MA family metallohydrolase [Thermodesulfobacteriota bacterium]|nr:peptidase MA family metallohydrolase [Thermodesulfobacteriota bacterium]